ncbi:MAG TPA: DUF3617 family protein [Vicinamibacterales bacterium]|nr:DUF3617 family protein [Vicinamibacterales bacterium]
MRIRPGRLTMLLPLAAIAGLPVWGLAQALDLRPGLWEVSMERQVNGQRASPLQDSECLTAQDVKALGDLRKFVTSGSLLGIEDTCTISDYKASGTKVTFTAACRDGDERSTVHVEATVSAEAYRIVADIKGDGLTSRLERSGRHVGSCSY